VNLLRELQRKRQEFYYEIRKGKVHFTEAAKVHQKNFLKRLVRFLRDSNVPVLLTAPIIWFCVFPIVFLDLAFTIYQAVCFPVYGIPKVRRSDFILFDRHRLAYLNLIEKLNCLYCAYANGVLLTPRRSRLAPNSIGADQTRAPDEGSAQPLPTFLRLRRCRRLSARHRTGPPRFHRSRKALTAGLSNARRMTNGPLFYL
jgi:hypothetical protein